MAHLLQDFLVLGAAAAALAVAFVCGVGLIVWMAGGKSVPRKRPGV